MQTFILFIAVCVSSLALSSNALSKPTCNGSDPTYWDSCTGSLSFRDGIIYSGEFSEGKMTGHGKATYPRSGNNPAGEYEGSFLNGARQGRGVYRYEDGTTYEGDFFNNKFHGHGELRLANGDTYIGEFLDNLASGQGIAEFKSGISWKGLWQNNSPSKYGLATLQNGTQEYAQLDLTKRSLIITDKNGIPKIPAVILVIDETPKESGDDIDYELLSNEIQKLLSNGKGISAKQLITKYISEMSDTTSIQQKAKAVNDLLEICMLMSDQQCYVENYDSHSNLLFEVWKDIPGGSDENQDARNEGIDNALAKHTYRNLLSFDETALAETAQYTRFEYPGSAKGRYASLRSSLDARAHALLGDIKSATRNQRRAKIFNTDNDLRLRTEQIALLYILENDLYYLNDSEQLIRFYRDCSATRERKIIPIQFNNGPGRSVEELSIFSACANTYHFNPYVYTKLLILLLESSAFRKDEELLAADAIHSLLKIIEIPEGSNLDHQRESFYGYFALQEAMGDAIPLNFSPLNEFEKLSLDSFDGIGINTYLQVQMQFNSHSQKEIDPLALITLDTTLSLLNESIKKSHKSLKMLLEPIYYIFQSLRARANKNLAQEVESLESYTRAQINVYNNSSQSILDKPPSISRSSGLVARYTISRLIEIAPASPALLDFSLFNIQAINSPTDANIQRAYALIQSSESNTEKELLLERIQLENQYDVTISRRYSIQAPSLPFDSNLRENLFEKSELFQGTSLTDADDLLAAINTNDQQLREKSKLPNSISSITHAQLLSTITRDETFVFFAEANSFWISILLSRDNWTVKIIPTYSLSQKSIEAIDTLSSQEIKEVPAERLLEYSNILSKIIFGDFTFTEEISFLGGPTILGIPYTLFSHPQTNRWLVETASPRAFFSINQRDRRRQTKSPTIFDSTYVAFANPLLRDDKTSTQVSLVEEMIRGVGSDISLLAELPETEIEVKALSKGLGGESKLFFSADANIDNLFKIDFNKVEVLSINTHGVMVGEIEGATSGSIVLSKTTTNNGLIPANWLFQIHGTPRVAFLLMCNSGSPNTNFDKSQINSISQAFSLKGTDAVVSSFWQVNSAATTALTSELSRLIRDGNEWGNALTLTIRQFIHSETWSHPSIWAAFTISGQYQKAPNAFDISPISKRLDIVGTVASKVSLPMGALFATASKDRIGFYAALRDRNNLAVWEDPINKPGAFTIYSTNIESDLHIANLFREKMDVYKLIERGSLPLVCSVALPEDITTEYLPTDFLVTKNALFVIIANKLKKPGEITYTVVSVDKNTCSVSAVRDVFVGPLSADVKLFRGPKEDQALLTHQFFINNNSPYDLGSDFRRSELGQNLQCKTRLQSKHNVVSADLRTVRESKYRDISFLESPRAQRDGVNIIFWDPCSGRQIARVADIDWFLQDNLMFDKNGNPLRNQFISPLETLINSSFTQAFNFWHFSNFFGDIVYVQGYIGSIRDPAVFARNGASQSAKLISQNLKSGLFALDIKNGGGWIKLANLNQCGPSSFPISFQGKPSFACVNNEANMKDPKITIYQYQ